jgi:hypothetical protein
LEWTITGTTKNSVPYLELAYDIKNLSKATNVHNQEIPVIFMQHIAQPNEDTSNFLEYSFSTCNTPYQNQNSRVSRTTYTNKHADLQLPNRSNSLSQLPRPRTDKTFQATEDWLSICNNDGEYLTIATFSPWIRAFDINKYYVPAMGRFAYGPHFDDSIKVYLSPIATMTSLTAKLSDSGSKS